MGRGSMSAAGRPRVVMLLANEYVYDTRVSKQARSLTAWGCEVWVLAMGREGLPRLEDQDGVHVERIDGRLWAWWRLAPIAALWWCPPLLRRCLPRAADPAAVPGAAETGRPAAARDRAAPARRPEPGLLRRIAWRVTAPIKRLAGPVLLLGVNTHLAARALALRPDAVEAHDLNTLLGGALVKKLGGAALVYDSHELFLERNIAGRSRFLANLVWTPLERFGIRRCDAIMSVADGICDHLARRYGVARPEVVRNVQPWEPPGPRTRLLAEELAIPRGVPIVIYPGGITINRGLEALIDSAPHLEGAVYVIMGYARNEDYLRSLLRRAETLGVLSSKVFFREAVPMERVVEYVASADLGIVPTRKVCLSYAFEASNKIFHCVMAGVPLAMSDHPEKRLLAERYGIGVLFDETDPCRIARAVNGVLADREGYERLRRNCLAAARELNWESEERRLRGVFARVLGPRGPAPPERAAEAPGAPPARAERAAPAEKRCAATA